MEEYDGAVPGTDRAWIELNLNNLEHNLRELRGVMPDGCEMMAVVKAEAYGHGAARISTHLQQLGVKTFAVATLDEAIRLRRSGITGEILILGYTCPSRAEELSRFNLIQTLTDGEHAAEMARQGTDIRVHLKIDTGMHRLGFDAAKLEDILEAVHLPHIHVEGIYTHLCVSDSLAREDVEFTRLQIERFLSLRHTLEMSGVQNLKTHVQSSYGLLNYPQLECDYARVGIALYGAYSSSGDETVLRPALRPVLSLKSAVASLRWIREGEQLGYGRAFTAQRDTRVALIPIGYADGVPRSLSCVRGYVLIHGQYAPIIGRVCMDQLTVDVTDISDAAVGMTVTFIGVDGDRAITAAQMAGAAGTIANELLSRLGQRLGVHML